MSGEGSPARKSDRPSVEELIARASAEAARGTESDAEQVLDALAGGRTPSMDEVLARARRLAAGHAAGQDEPEAWSRALDALAQGGGEAAGSASLSDAMAALAGLPGDDRTGAPPAPAPAAGRAAAAGQAPAAGQARAAGRAPAAGQAPALSAPAPAPAAPALSTPTPAAPARAANGPAPEVEAPALDAAPAQAEPREIPLQLLAEARTHDQDADEDPIAEADMGSDAPDAPPAADDTAAWSEEGFEVDVDGEFSFEESREFDALSELTAEAGPGDTLAGGAILIDEEQFSDQPTALHTRDQIAGIGDGDDPLTPLPPPRPESEDDLSSYQARPALGGSGDDREDFGESLSVNLAAGALDADQLIASDLDQLAGEDGFDVRATQNLDRGTVDDYIDHIEELDDALLMEAPLEELDMEDAEALGDDDASMRYAQPPPLPPSRASSSSLPPPPPDALAGGTPPYPHGAPPQGQPPGAPVYPTGARPDPYAETGDEGNTPKRGFFRRIFNKDT